MDGYQSSTYGDGFADVYDEWYAALPLTEQCASRIARLAAGGRVLEMGVGTGRIALALADHGVEIVGLDASAAMLAALRSKPGGGRVCVALADMAAPPLARAQFAVVVVAFNTLFDLPDEDAQRRCLAAAHALVHPGGVLAVETIVFPDTDRPVQGVDARIIEIDRVVLTAPRLDPATRSVTGQHIEITEAGVRLRAWLLHYLLPR